MSALWDFVNPPGGLLKSFGSKMPWGLVKRTPPPSEPSMSIDSVSVVSGAVNCHSPATSNRNAGWKFSVSYVHESLNQSPYFLPLGIVAPLRRLGFCSAMVWCDTPLAPFKSVFFRSAPLRLAPKRVAPRRSAPWRRALLSSASCRAALRKIVSVS